MNRPGRADGGENDREPIPRRVKQGLYRTQRGRCAYCGRANGRLGFFQIDHKFPVSRGGTDEIDNLQLLCAACNMRKGIQSDGEFRRRYRKVLSTGGGIPSRPIPQGDFTRETQRTRAPKAVRSIYRERFEGNRNRRRRRGKGRPASPSRRRALRRRRRRGPGFGWLVVAALVAIALLFLWGRTV